MSSSWSEVVLAEAVEKCSDINSLVVVNGELLSQLMVASYHGNPEYVQDLLKVQGIKIDLQNSDGRHALMCASQLGHRHIVQSILNACQFPQTLVNLPDKNGTTTLMIASMGDYTEIVLVLLQNGALIDALDSNGWSALMIASMCGCTSTVSVLIKNGANVNMENEDGCSSLTAAVKHGHDKIISILIQNGAFVEREDKKEDKMEENIKKEKKENQYELNYNNVKILMDAFFEDNPAVIVAAASAGDAAFIKEFLIRHPNKVNDKTGGTAAIHMAALSGHTDVMKTIMEFNPDLEVEDANGNKPLHHAAFRDMDKMAEMIIHAGANVNSKNDKEVTALIIAAVQGHTKVLRILAHHPSILLDSYVEEKSIRLKTFQHMYTLRQ